MAKTKPKSAQTLPLPDPKAASGPFRAFTDPGWCEAWWWLGLPIAVAVFITVAYAISPDWYRHWIVREGIGFLETAQFILMVVGFAITVQLLFSRYVWQRPFMLAVTILAALSCFYIGGEEVSWGQHLFFWDASHLITAENHGGEFSVHNMYGILERAPRTVLEIGVYLGGILVPLWCVFTPKLRASRLAVFLPAAILAVPAIGALIFKFVDVLGHQGLIPTIVGRPSEAIEFYLYFFMMAYLIVFDRRIAALEAEAGKTGR